MKKIFIANAVHPNMNYDRSIKSVIWDKFPRIYRLFLDYIEERPYIKIHFQLPAQTYNSLKICGKDVIGRLRNLSQKGQVRYMGTFYSEPLGMCMDEMSILDSSDLGCEITEKELGKPEGFFLQEIAYFPQMPYIINKHKLKWVLLKDWENELFFPYEIEGLDGSKCVAVPCIGSEDIKELGDISKIPDKSLLLFHNDLEIPETVYRCEELRANLKKINIESEWTFIGNYLKEYGTRGLKKPAPSTNKPEGPGKSPSYSRWVSKPIDIITHNETRKAMEKYRTAGVLCLNENIDVNLTETYPRSYITYDVESLNDYPWVEKSYFQKNGKLNSLSKIKHLIAWGTNSDARGWFPLFERTVERRESFKNAREIADQMVRTFFYEKNKSEDNQPGYYAVNLFPDNTYYFKIMEKEPIKIKTQDNLNIVNSIEMTPYGYEHNCIFRADAYSIAPLFKEYSNDYKLLEKEKGNRIATENISLQAQGTDLNINGYNRKLRLKLEPFRILVKRLDKKLRKLNPENGVRTYITKSIYPTLFVEKQIDWHIHFHSEYTLVNDSIYARWKFYFTAPTLVEAEIPKKLNETDFTPGGIKAKLFTETQGDVYYDVPFGIQKHINSKKSFITAYSYVFNSDKTKGTIIASKSGVQSYEVYADKGEIALCLGKSTTSGGIRKLGFQVGKSVTNVKAETEWYNEIFYGEYIHDFVIQMFTGSWKDNLIPVKAESLASNLQFIQTNNLFLKKQENIFNLKPYNVRLCGYNEIKNKIVLNESIGKEANYNLQIKGKNIKGKINPFQILEIDFADNY